MKQKRLKRIFVCLLFALFIVPATGYAQTQTINGPQTNGSVQVQGRIGEETPVLVDEDQGSQGNDSDKTVDEGRTKIVADVSSINKGQLPKTGSLTSTNIMIVGLLILISSIYLMYRRFTRNIKE